MFSRLTICALLLSISALTQQDNNTFSCVVTEVNADFATVVGDSTDRNLDGVDKKHATRYIPREFWPLAWGRFPSQEDVRQRILKASWVNDHLTAIEKCVDKHQRIAKEHEDRIAVNGVPLDCYPETKEAESVFINSLLVKH